MKEKSKLLKNTLTVGAFTALSRVLGLVREMLQARLIGAGVEQSAFTLAFAIPNMARKLFGEGALTAAFVPVFRDEIEHNSFEKASALARAVITMVLLILSVVVILALLSLQGVYQFRSHFSFGNDPRFLLTIELVQILVPYMLFICGAAFGMGVLNTLGKFKASSFMPCFLNIVWISSLAYLGFRDVFTGESLTATERIRAISYAILAGGFAQMIFMFYCMAKVGVAPKLTFKGWGESSVRKVWRNLVIAALGSGAVQVNYMLDQVLAQMASPWAAGVIGYAERLMDLPLGIIGVAFGTVLLPTFAKFFSVGDMEGAKSTLNASLSSLMFVMVPAAAGLFILSSDVTRVIYEGGDFDSLATLRVSRALAVYALGLGFFGYQKSLVPWFQAQSDMKTPLRVSLVTIIINATLNILAVAFLHPEWRHVGLAWSTVFCAAIGCALLTFYAYKKNDAFSLIDCIKPILKIFIASSVMSVGLIIVKRFIHVGNSIFSLSIFVATGIIIYAILSAILLPSHLKKLFRKI